MAAVPAPAGSSGLDDYLVVSGGRTANVVALNVRTGAFAAHRPLSHAMTNACGVGCRGFWFTQTGDIVKKAADEAAALQN